MVKNMEQGYYGPISSKKVEVFRMDDAAHDKSAIYHLGDYTVGENGRARQRVVWDHYAAPTEAIDIITAPDNLTDQARKASRVFTEATIRKLDEDTAAFDEEMARLDALYSEQMSALKQVAGQEATPASPEAPQSAPQTAEQQVQAMLDRIYTNNPDLNWRAGLEPDSTSTPQNDHNTQIDAPTEKITPVTTFGTPEELINVGHAASSAASGNVRPFATWSQGNDSHPYSQYRVTLMSSCGQRPTPAQASIPKPGAEKVGSPADRNATVPHGRRPNSSNGEQDGNGTTPLTVLPGGRYGAGLEGVATGRPAAPGGAIRTPYGRGERTDATAPKPTGKERGKTTASRRGNFLKKHGRKLLIGGVALAAATAAGLGIWAAVGGHDGETAHSKIKAYGADKVFTQEEMDDLGVNPTVSQSYIAEYGDNATAGMNGLNHDMDSAVAANELVKVYPGGVDNYGDPLWYPQLAGQETSFGSTSKAAVEPILAKQPGSEMRVAKPNEVEHIR